jgi:hypothetical protein
LADSTACVLGLCGWGRGAFRRRAHL